MPISAGSELIGPFPDGVDPVEYDRERRRVLWRIPTGLYLLGSRDGERRNLMTCSLVTQLSTRPKIVGVGVESGSISAGLIGSSGWFALSLLARADRDVVRRFVKPAVEDDEARTLSGQEFVDAPVGGAPILARALAYIDCRVREAVEFGSHTLFAGEVHAAGFGNKDGSEDDDVLRMEDTRMNYGG